MRTAIALAPAWLAALACAGQTMPYPVGWVYTTCVLDPENLAFIASTVADTGGESGHTASAVAKLTAPDGRIAYGTGGWSFSSFASASISLCDATEQCHDGWFRASSEGTQEYCPIASAYMIVSMSHADRQQPPFATAVGALWDPASVARKNGKSDFLLRITKSSNCPGGEAEGTIAVFATDGLEYSLTPGMLDPNKSAFIGNSATVRWRLETRDTNPTAGQVLGAADVLAAPCTIIRNQKSATLTVQ